MYSIKSPKSISPVISPQFKNASSPMYSKSSGRVRAELKLVTFLKAPERIPVKSSGKDIIPLNAVQPLNAFSPMS